MANTQPSAMANSKPIAIGTAEAQNHISQDLRNNIYSALLSADGIRNIEASLDRQLAESGFKDELRSYVTHLFRSGQATSVDQARALAMDSIRQQMQGHDDQSDGANREEQKYHLKIPNKAIVEGTKTVRRELEKVCDITEDDSSPLHTRVLAAQAPWVFVNVSFDGPNPHQMSQIVSLPPQPNSGDIHPDPPSLERLQAPHIATDAQPTHSPWLPQPPLHGFHPVQPDVHAFHPVQPDFHAFHPVQPDFHAFQPIQPPLHAFQPAQPPLHGFHPVQPENSPSHPGQAQLLAQQPIQSQLHGPGPFQSQLYGTPPFQFSMYGAQQGQQLPWDHTPPPPLYDPQRSSHLHGPQFFPRQPSQDPPSFQPFPQAPHSFQPNMLGARASDTGPPQPQPPQPFFSLPSGAYSSTEPQNVSQSMVHMPPLPIIMRPADFAKPPPPPPPPPPSLPRTPTPEGWSAPTGDCYECFRAGYICQQQDTHGNRIMFRDLASCTMCRDWRRPCRSLRYHEWKHLSRRCNMCHVNHTDGRDCSDHLPCPRCRSTLKANACRKRGAREQRKPFWKA